MHPKGPLERDADRLLRVMDLLRKKHGEMTITQAMIFLKIASEPNLDQSEITIATGISPSLISRTIAHLGDIGDRNGKGAMKLVKSYGKSDRGADRRGKYVTLTADGERLMREIGRELQRMA